MCAYKGYVPGIRVKTGHKNITEDLQAAKTPARILIPI